MKKLLLIICLFVSLPVFSQDLDGKWIDEDGELAFTTSNDTLYIDTADSGCGCSIFHLVKKRTALSKKFVEYDAYVVFSQDENNLDKKALLELKQLTNKIYLLNIHYMNKKRIYDIHETYYIKRIGT